MYFLRDCLVLLFETGVAFINGEAWKVQRKFFIQVLKERGSISMKNDIAGALYDSIKSTIDDLKAKKGEPVNLVELLTHKCNTNLRVSMFGETGISEEQLQKMVELYGEEVASTTAMNVLLIGKIAKYLIFPLKPEYYKTLKNQKKLKSMLFGVINEHKATYDEENMRDVIDEYFKERDTRRSKGDPTAEYFTDESLVESLILFVGDGVLSIAAFASSMLTHLIDNPEEQEKVYKEIVEVIGLDRQPSIEDKSNLTYLNAFIQESLRATNMFPFFPSLQCTKETTLNGYRIPKGAITLVNFYSIHNDPEVYEEPKKFNPSRYIQTAGKQRAELPVPFGVGKRACLGESFTMMQIFLFVATIVQNFRLTLPEVSSRTSLHFEKLLQIHV
ncbi:cytochrome P450 18a1 [Caerostris extrusa]|uniref:Cytochrome P450 18a1 n=1 Tax=Caerostris extrusa TaxID=172846 RepID=A0AAV4NM04_CAEEX|nr:cytochrome P450 18a1 [Caerostris extrusa]